MLVQRIKHHTIRFISKVEDFANGTSAIIVDVSPLSKLNNRVSWR